MWISKKRWEHLINKIGVMNDRLLQLEHDTTFYDIPTVTPESSSGCYSRVYSFEELKYYKITNVKKVLTQLMDSLGYEIITEPEKAKVVKVSKVDITKL